MWTSHMGSATPIVRQIAGVCHSVGKGGKLLPLNIPPPPSDSGAPRWYFGASFARSAALLLEPHDAGGT